jgi:hypothetical protein
MFGANVISSYLSFGFCLYPLRSNNCLVQISNRYLGMCVSTVSLIFIGFYCKILRYKYKNEADHEYFFHERHACLAPKDQPSKSKTYTTNVSICSSTKFWNCDDVSDSSDVSLCLAQINLLQTSRVHFK